MPNEIKLFLFAVGNAVLLLICFAMGWSVVVAICGYIAFGLIGFQIARMECVKRWMES